MAKLGYKDKNMNWAFQESQGNWYQTPRMEKSKSFDNMSYRDVRQESPAKRLPVPLPLQHTSPPYVPVTAAGYVDDRIQNTFLEEIYSDIGVKDTFDLDLLEFESSNFVPFNPLTQLPDEGDVFDETISFADRLLDTSGGPYLEQQESFVGLSNKGYIGDSEKDVSRSLVKNVTDDELQREKMKGLKGLASGVVDIEGGTSTTHLNKALASPTVTSSSHSSDSKNLQLGSGGPSSMSSAMGSPHVHSTNRCSSREGSEDIMTSPRPPGSAASSDSSSGADKDITDRVPGQKGNKSDLSRRVFFPLNNSPSSLPSSPAKVKLEPGTVQRAKSVDDFTSSDRVRQMPLASRLESLEESPDKNERLDQLADLKSPISLSGLTENAKGRIGGSGVMAFRLTPELRPLSPSKTPQHLVGPRRIVHPVPPSLSMRVGGDDRSGGSISQQLMGPDFRDRSGLKESVTNLPSSQGGSPPMEQESKRARVIASGSDLLEDVRQSYQYVAGADMFARPTAPSGSSAMQMAPALQTTAGMPRPTVYPPPQKIPGVQPSLPEGMMTPRYSSSVQPQGQQGQGYNMMPQQQQYVADGNGLQGQTWNRQPPPYTTAGAPEGMADSMYGPAQSTPNYRQMYMQKIMTRRNMLETGQQPTFQQQQQQQQQLPMGISPAGQLGRENVHPGMKLQQPSQQGYYGDTKPSPMVPVQQMNRPLPLAQIQQHQQTVASPTFPGPYAGEGSSNIGMMSPRRLAFQSAVGGYRNPVHQLGDQVSTPPRIGDRVSSPGLGGEGGFPGHGSRVDQGSWRSSGSSYEGGNPQQQLLGGPQQAAMVRNISRDSRSMSPARFFANREMSGGVTSPVVIEDLSYARPAAGSFYEGGGEGGFMPKVVAPRVPSAGGSYGQQQGWMDYPRPSSGRSTPGYGSSMGMPPPPYPHTRDDYGGGGPAMSGSFNMDPSSVYGDPRMGEMMAPPPFPSDQPPPFNRPEGLMQHIMNDRTNVFRSHPFFPLLRDLIIADMNFHSASFPFQLISNLPADFGRLLQNYMNRNPAAANYHCSETVERVIMDALRCAHQGIMEKIQARKQSDAEKGIAVSNPIDDFCDRFERAVQRNMHETGGLPAMPHLPPPSQPPVYMDRPSGGVPPSHSGGKAIHPLSQSAPCTPQKSSFKPGSTRCAGDNASSPSETDSPSRNSNAGASTGKNKVLPKEAVAAMLQWLRDHQANPYPNDDEKEQLMQQTKLTINQINYWFTNARRRILPKWALQRYMEQQQQQQQQVGMHYGLPMPPPHMA